MERDDIRYDQDMAYFESLYQDQVKQYKREVVESESEDEQSDAGSAVSLGVEIATREDLKEKIHELHNFLRNNGVGYGMNALKVFNLFYGLARIEQKNLFEMTGLDPSCKFSTLLENARVDKLNQFANYIGKFQDMLENSKVDQFVLFEIPNVSTKTLTILVQEID